MSCLRTFDTLRLAVPQTLPMVCFVPWRFLSGLDIPRNYQPMASTQPLIEVTHVFVLRIAGVLVDTLTDTCSCTVFNRLMGLTLDLPKAPGSLCPTRLVLGIPLFRLHGYLATEHTHVSNSAYGMVTNSVESLTAIACCVPIDRGNTHGSRIIPNTRCRRYRAHPR